MRTELTYDTHKEMLQLHSYFITEIPQIILLVKNFIIIWSELG